MEIKEQADRFLRGQAEQWHLFGSALAAWLCALTDLYEQHKLTSGQNEGDVRAELKVG